ncbi:hypothetical protein Tco_0082165, partial [Tanacetum coccineum]
MVYHNNEASHAKDGGKLEPKWEGPYEVKESLGKGAYKLKDRKRNDMPRTWNICNLKKCYIHEMKRIFRKRNKKKAKHKQIQARKGKDQEKSEAK